MQLSEQLENVSALRQRVRALEIENATLRSASSPGAASLIEIVIRQMPFFVSISAPDLTSVFLNEAGRRMMGLPLDADVSRIPIPEFFHPDDQALIRDVALPAVARDGGWEGECRFRHFDGGTGAMVRWRAFACYDDRGRYIGAAAIAVDMSETALCDTRQDGPLVYAIDADDDSRQALAGTLQRAGCQVKVFASTRSFLEIAPVLAPGCVLLDVKRAADLVVPEELRSRHVELPVVVVVECGGDVEFAVRAMRAGAVDLVQTPYEQSRLLTAISSALAGMAESEDRNQAADTARARVARLSAREREVLDGLLDGGTNKTIAKELGISPRTVEIHRAHVMERLGVPTLPEAVQIAMCAGMPARTARMLQSQS